MMWIKETSRYLIQNTVIFAALLFSGSFLNEQKILASLGGYFIVLVFSLQHMVLFADGHSSRKPVIDALTHFILAGSLLGVTFTFNVQFGVLCLLYLLIRYAYMIWLRHILIVNVAVLPAEMAIKGAAGAVIIEVPLSGWGIVCLFLIALLISLGKTKNMLKFSPTYSPLVERYSPKLMNEMMAVVSSSTILAYCLYTIAPETVHNLGTDKLLYSVPFVLYGIFRYLWLINMVDLKGGVEAYLFRDKAMGLNLLCWISSLVIIFSLGPKG